MTLALAKTPAELAYGTVTLPHRRMEDWRWTDLRRLIDRPYPPFLAVPAADADIARLMASSPVAKLARARLVFVNGAYDAGRSTLPASGKVTVGAGVPAGFDDADPLSALNRAFAKDGISLKIADTIDAPIEILSIVTAGEPRTVALRHRVEVAEGASATLIETHVGEGSYLLSCVSAVTLGKAARLDRVKIETEGPEAVHLAHAIVALGESAQLRDFTLTAGARLNRQNGTYTFAGINADARISGAYLLAGRQHADTRLTIDHAVPHGTSRELFKCVLDGEARGVFQGKVIVRPHAQKSDGKQSCHALLLSGTAEFDAKPELEIFADDVICGHGATAGELDRDHLFYLRSRGIPEAEARAMLVAAFAGEAFETIANESIRAALTEVAAAWLERRI